MMVLLAFLFGSLLVTALGLMLAPRGAATIEQRLGELTGTHVKGPFEDAGHHRMVVEALKRIGDVAPKSLSEMGKLQQKLVTAGFRSNEALAVFIGIRLGLALLAFAIMATPVLFRPNVPVALGAAG